MKLNPKIVEKIQNSETEDELKNFLKEILRLELRHVPGWHFGEDYDTLIGKYIMKEEVKK